MLDHVLGRPSTKSRRLQVLAVLSFWSFYLFKYAPQPSHLPETTSNILKEATEMDPPASAPSPASSRAP